MVVALASRSPRRAALLEEAGIAFELGPFPDVDETPPGGVPPAEVARLLAERKVRAVLPLVGERVALAADTIVFLDYAILGKPAGREQARRMLRCLSGRTHGVATGVAVGGQGRVLSGVDLTWVRFRPLSEAQIEAYVASDDSLDKAGGYGIQGAAGDFVEELDGRLDTVVGLTLPRVRALLDALAQIRETPGR